VTWISVEKKVKWWENNMSLDLTIDTNAIVTIIGFVSVIIALYQTHSRFDAMASKIDSHISASRCELQAMGQRIDAQGQRIDAVHKEIMELIKHIK
jgi:cell division protein FtsL